MAATDIEIPGLGESVTEATLIKWHKRDGDAVEADEALCELETDKANVDVPSPAAGVLKRLKAEGDTVQVGESIGTVDPDGKAGASSSSSSAASSASSSAAETEPRDAATAEARAEARSDGGASAASSRAMGAEATGATGAKAGGNGSSASAAALDDLSPAVRRIVVEKGFDPASIRATGPGGRLTKEDVLNHADAAASGGVAASGGAVASGGAGGRTSATPVGQHPGAGQEVVSSSEVGGKAPPRPSPSEAVGGTVGKPAAAPSASGSNAERVRRVPMSKLRKRIAQTLVSAQQTAAILTTFNEIDLSQVIALRKQHKEAFEKKHGVGLGFMSFFATASVAALQEFERVNGSIDGDDLVYHDYVNLGIAVSTERGLTVPVLKDVQEMSFAQIESRDQARRPRRPRRQARGGGDERRDVHDHQRRRVRLAAEHADPHAPAVAASSACTRSSRAPSPSARSSTGSRSGR